MSSDKTAVVSEAMILAAWRAESEVLTDARKAGRIPDNDTRIKAMLAAAAPVNRDAVLEECARVCDERRQEEANTPSWETAYARGEGARCCANGIRALKSEGEGR